MGQLLDTTVDARRRQLEAYRAMAPGERLRLAEQMSDDVRSLARSGIRARHGAALSDQEVDVALARILLGADIAEVTTARGPGPRR